MELIDKDALVAEIERQQRRCDILYQSNDVELRKTAAIQNGVYCYILSFLNTLEVKEVDLEKVIEEYFKGWTDDYDNGGAACHYQYVQVQDCKAIAKHFFELGLKAQKVE